MFFHTGRWVICFLQEHISVQRLHVICRCRFSFDPYRAAVLQCLALLLCEGACPARRDLLSDLSQLVFSFKEFLRVQLQVLKEHVNR